MENAHDKWDWIVEHTVDFTPKGWITYAQITPAGWVVIVLIAYVIFRIGRWFGRREKIAEMKRLKN